MKELLKSGIGDDKNVCEITQENQNLDEQQ